MQSNTFSELFVGQKIVTLSRIDSTNTYLKDKLSKSAPLPEGTVILAEEQYAGRGQMNNAWVSEPGKNLTFSILLCPSFLSVEKQFILNKAISIAVNDVLFKIIGKGVKIKWPNDIYYNDMKLGGILIENILRGARIKHSVVGIGININQSEFPDSIRNVTSVFKILHHHYDLKTLLTELCREIQVRYLQLKAGKFQQLNLEYLEKIYRLNEIHPFIVNNQRVEGAIRDVDERGFLKIQFDEGIKSFTFKEINFVIS